MTKEEYYARIIWLKAIISIVLFVLGAANIAIALTFQKMNIRIGFLFIQYDIVTASCFSIVLFIIAFILLITGPSFERKTKFSSVYEYRQYKKKQKFKVSCSFKNEIDSMISDLILQVLVDAYWSYHRKIFDFIYRFLYVSDELLSGVFVHDDPLNIPENLGIVKFAYNFSFRFEMKGFTLDIVQKEFTRLKPKNQAIALIEEELINLALKFGENEQYFKARFWDEVRDRNVEI
ncbi:MAG: hypothetical protein ACTSSI_17765 [Candidatus Helarchaeota archaeon]